MKVCNCRRILDIYSQGLLSINRREDASILCAGRAFLPAPNQTSIRQRIHRPVVQLPEPNRKAP